ncbi:hypothetical protein DFH08DRAFT_708551 [Mycena albidolilacea]|uniref:Uncharacterized protein n=1 Tax=Mycena albidolilacea TaxID=1033008 RepID=A0AAD7EKT1_9AGAR|nr:hypothetical protein DFH08DRAFT_708551 [Mycena albidolilacea]
MKFPTAFIAAATTLIFSGKALAALTPDQVVGNINIVTSVSGNINSVLGGLSTTPTPSQAQTISQTVVTGFQTIINDLAGDVTAMQATPPFSDGADLIVAALTDVIEHDNQFFNALLSTVIGKHTIFAQFGLTGPITAVLRSLEASIDSFAFALIAMIPTKQADVTTDKNMLDGSVDNTISLYQQLCVPSPLYPTIPPICVII